MVKKPELANELGIGRPDMHKEFDDGGLIDVNHVPGGYLLHLPGVDKPLARRIVELRKDVGGFSSVGDMEVTLDLEPGALQQAKDLMLFRKLW